MLDNAYKIEGWMGDTDLRWLADNSKNRNLILEIGSWQGRSSRALGDNCPGRVVCVDHWTGSVTDGYIKEDYSEIYSIFLKNNLDLVLSGKITPINLNSERAFSVLRDIKFDMIFIDGAHDYENVNKDITMWKKCLNDGGLMSGHDAQHPPVQKAVIEHYVEYKQKGTVWYI
jgi:predicted O-methyltransferase YrrM